MFKGSFAAYWFYLLGSIFALISLVVIYQQSQYYHHQPPFPKRTISQVAQHYPQFLIFRTSTISGSALLVLGWLTNYFFLCTFTQQHKINLSSYHPKTPLIAGISGGILLMFSTAAIDTGKMFQLFHDVCATSFFIVTFFAQIYNTVIVAYLYQKSSAINKYNLYFKYVILGLLALQLVESSVKGYTIDQIVSLGDPRSNFFQWTLTTTIISNFLSIAFDVKDYEFVYVEKSSGNEHGNGNQPGMIM